MDIKALVIDVDGTMYSRGEAAMDASISVTRFKEYLDAEGVDGKIPESEVRRVERMMMKTTQISFHIRALSLKYGLDYRKFDDYVNDHQPRDIGITKDPKLVSLISSLSRTYRIFAFTNAPTIWSRRVIRTIGLSGIIKERMVVNGNSLGMYLKPQPQAFRKMLELTGMRKQDVLFMDDNEDNIKAARRLGIRSALVINNGGSRKDTIYGILEYIRDNGRLAPGWK